MSKSLTIRTSSYNGKPTIQLSFSNGQWFEFFVSSVATDSSFDTQWFARQLYTAFNWLRKRPHRGPAWSVVDAIEKEITTPADPEEEEKSPDSEQDESDYGC